MKKILITGADRGIGLELVKQFINDQYNVIATYHIEPSDTLKQLNKDKKLTIFDLDVTSEQSINQLVRQLNKKSIDVLIHNTDIAGPAQQNLSEMDFESWQNTFHMNAIAPFAVTQSMLEMLMRTNTPKVISLYNQSNQHISNMYAYQSALAAQNKIMLMLANELKKQEVIVTPVQLYREILPTEVDESHHNEKSAQKIVSLIKNLTLADSGKIQFLINELNEELSA